MVPMLWRSRLIRPYLINDLVNTINTFREAEYIMLHSSISFISEGIAFANDKTKSKKSLPPGSDFFYHYSFIEEASAL